jgi:hypothetical protein
MDNALEALLEHLRHHFQQPIPGRGKLPKQAAGYTVYEIVPANVHGLAGGVAGF